MCTLCLNMDLMCQLAELTATLTKASLAIVPVLCEAYLILLNYMVLSSVVILSKHP